MGVSSYQKRRTRSCEDAVSMPALHRKARQYV